MILGMIMIFYENKIIFFNLVKIENMLFDEMFGI